MHASGDITAEWPRIRRVSDHDGRAPRVIGVDAVMGTAIRVEIVGETGGAILDEVFAWFHEVDERFSMFRAESEMNRLAHGLLGVDDVHPHVREVLGMCEAVRVSSGGAFDARHHRRDGLLDPTGLVKGWSVDRAGIILTGEGFADWSIDAGGDILVHGRPDTSEGWRVGIQHPRERDAAAAIIDVSDGAVATSGSYERGGHIMDARGGTQPADVLSATVVGRELALADAYATAAFAMGADAVPWLASLRGYDGCVITSDDRVIWTGGLGTTAVSRS